VGQVRHRLVEAKIATECPRSSLLRHPIGRDGEPVVDFRVTRPSSSRRAVPHGLSQ